MTLNVSHLSFSYGPKQALTDVSFEVEKGCFAALLGPNGAGKSTLFALMTRLLTAKGGEINVAGNDLATAPQAALAEMGIVFQKPTLDLDLTVRQNLTYFAALHGLSGKTGRNSIDKALERLGISDRAAEKVRSLNGGHRRRTELARALVHDPSVLLLDEPTVGLDARSRKAITTHVHDLAKEGLTVLWATHLTDEIEETDQLILLHQGNVLQDGTAKNLCADHDLQTWFLAQTKVQP
ncbi:MAG: ABC transporter ATP-binding protein [Pelagimonas sp.]|uniref:ABC transporter ATP-binding protein n=1 Tax=Pelagimonas sp. TaxID=2073170 RepID=UPI003D6B9D64